MSFVRSLCLASLAFFGIGVAVKGWAAVDGVDALWVATAVFFLVRGER